MEFGKGARGVWGWGGSGVRGVYALGPWGGGAAYESLGEWIEGSRGHLGAYSTLLSVWKANVYTQFSVSVLPRRLP